jgi:Flp pilus assembly protein TadG
MYLRGLWANPVRLFQAGVCAESVWPGVNCLSRFRRENKAASAVEFALVALPFLFLVLAILQLSVFYMAQSSLNAGVVSAANCLRSTFTTASLPAANCPFTTTTPTASTIKTQVVAASGGLIHNDSTLAVEIRQIADFDSSLVPIADGVTDYGSSATNVLVLRAQSKVVTFFPGLGSLENIRSSAIVRRQGT